HGRREPARADQCTGCARRPQRVAPAAEGRGEGGQLPAALLAGQRPARRGATALMHGAPAFLFSNACSTVRPVSPVSQLSLFSAAARPPRPGDLAGLLCGPGQIVRFGSGDTARLSVVLADPRRAPVVVATCTAVGIDAEPVATESGATAVGTASRRDLVGLAHAWTRRGEEAGACRGTGADEPGSPASSLREAVTTVPAGMLLDGAVLRVWMLA